jgi:hypothetical protein
MKYRSKAYDLGFGQRLTSEIAEIILL